MSLDEKLSFVELFDAIPDAMGLQDTERRIVRYNAAGYAYLGMGPEETIGKHCYELIGRDKPCEPCATSDAVRDGIPTSIIKHIPKTETWFNVRAYPLRNSEGEVVGVVEHLRDISEAKRLQVKLEELNQNLENQVDERTAELKENIEELNAARERLIESETLSALGRMVAGISHEVNTPLGVALTSASYITDLLKNLADHGNPAPVFSEGLQDTDSVLGQISEASELVNRNLLRASKLMTGFKKIAADRTSEQMRRIDPLAYLQDLFLSLGHEFKNTGIELVFVERPPQMLGTFPGALSQVFTNLLMNSLIHAYPNGGSGVIQIDIREMTGKTDGVEIVYEDDGCGMDAETLKRMYEPFYSARLGGEGIGLGMNITYNLVLGKLQGGILCDSAPGKGSRFTLHLPDIPPLSQ